MLLDLVHYRCLYVYVHLYSLLFSILAPHQEMHHTILAPHQEHHTKNPHRLLNIYSMLLLWEFVYISGLYKLVFFV